ncbi:MAG: MOSC N-terminal beta barrel domain-containing protein [Deltaproteobacteria bacterium]|nr:MOSC N-terminal beta barrel domain-containing protein [Deltaproteobacteria bacterium]MBV8451468.1 MOSC N-terminal beta barrel domain-containing protein [Deltaproteobacteria bacterium]
MQYEAKVVGGIASIWRYPVKSMIGEEISNSFVTQRGLLGDRSYALIDRVSGKVVSAKNPRKWPNMFDFRAAYTAPLNLQDEGVPPVEITMPDGTSMCSSEKGLDSLLSNTLGRSVSLQSRPLSTPKLEEYWPDLDNLAHRETVTEETMPPETFFDGAVVHLLTTSTLKKLSSAYPQGVFEPRRFRPNLIVAPQCEAEGFVENLWVGCTLIIGEEIRLKITGLTARCVMTTLAQGGLPKDLGILRAAVQANGANVGVYAAVERGGVIHIGDEVKVEAST